jgi:hypothetical protein
MEPHKESERCGAPAAEKKPRFQILKLGRIAPQEGRLEAPTLVSATTTPSVRAVE